MSLVSVSFNQFINTYGGLLFAVLGAGTAVFMAGIGSARGCAMVGKAAAGIVAEEPEKFSKALILQLLPGTQGLYGFVIGLLISVLHITTDLTLSQGIYLFFAAMPVAIVGLTSAKLQAEVSTAGLQILVKNPAHNTKGMIFAAIVETYAILGFVASIILVLVTFR